MLFILKDKILSSSQACIVSWLSSQRTRPWQVRDSLAQNIPQGVAGVRRPVKKLRREGFVTTTIRVQVGEIKDDSTRGTYT